VLSSVAGRGSTYVENTLSSEVGRGSTYIKNAQISVVGRGSTYIEKAQSSEVGRGSMYIKCGVFDGLKGINENKKMRCLLQSEGDQGRPTSKMRSFQ